MYLDLGPGQCWESPQTCTTGFSYCLWVKFNSLADSGVLGSIKDSTTEGFMLRFVNGNLKNRVTTNDERYQLIEPHNTTTWNHLCTTWIPTTLRFYKNGALWNSDSSPATDSGQPLGDSKILLGGWFTELPSSQTRNFVLDEFAFWHRDKLSATDVLNLYNSY